MRMAPGQRLTQSMEIAMMLGTRNAFENLRLPISIGGAVLAACALFAVGSVEPCLAAPSSQTAFASPKDASQALASAVQQHDERAVREILGGQSEIISSDDKVEDTLDRERFAQKYQEMHRLVRESGGVMTLYVGAENWPFPVPLVSRDGMWRFESKVGTEEIRFRRIGENEVTAIGMCATLVTAETHPGTDSEADAASPSRACWQTDSLPRLLLPHPLERRRRICRHRLSGRVPLFRSDDFHRHPEWPRDGKRSRPKYGENRGSHDRLPR